MEKPLPRHGDHPGSCILARNYEKDSLRDLWEGQEGQVSS